MSVTSVAGFTGVPVVGLLVREVYSVKIIDDLSTITTAKISKHITSVKITFAKSDVHDVFCWFLYDFNRNNLDLLKDETC